MRAQWIDAQKFEMIAPHSLQIYPNHIKCRCVKYAVDKGFDIAILAHLDNMKEYTWRNILQVGFTRAILPAASLECLPALPRVRKRAAGAGRRPLLRLRTRLT